MTAGSQGARCPDDLCVQVGPPSDPLACNRTDPAHLALCHGDLSTDTLTLTDFLLARIAEDEAAADQSKADLAMNPGLHVPADWVIGVADRVLAECKAKRRIVALHSAGDEGTCETCYIHAEGVADNPHACPTLRALAAVYADHPDYRDEWRP